MYISSLLKKCLLGAVVLSAATTLSAQRYSIVGGHNGMVSPTDTSADVTFDAKVKIKNNLSETINITWVQNGSTFTDTKWKYFALCDAMLCHDPIPFTYDFELGANESADLKITVTPDHLAGADTISVIVYARVNMAAQADTLYCIADARTLGIGKPIADRPLQVYPNPAQHALFLQWNSTSQFIPETLNISNISGQTV